MPPVIRVFIVMIWLSSAAAANLGQPRFQRLTIEDGLSQNTIFALLHDRKGYVWVGTQDGLNRYDGYQFQHFEDGIAYDSLNDNHILALAQDGADTLWIGTQGGGLSAFNPKTEGFQTWDKDNSNLPTNMVTCLEIDGNGKLWIGTDQGLWWFDGNQFMTAHPLNNPWVRDLYANSDGTIWVGTNSELLLFSRDGKVLQRYDGTSPGQELPTTTIGRICQDSRGRVWVGTPKGLAMRPVGETQFLDLRHDPERESSIISDRISTITEDHKGRIWVATWKGLDLYDEATGGFIHIKNTPSDPNSLSHNMVHETLVDRQGSLWVGTHNGLNKLDPGTEVFRHYRADPSGTGGLNDNLVMAVEVDQEGVLWMGTMSQGLHGLNRETGEIHHFLHDAANPQSLAHNAIMALYEDGDSGLWVGTWGGGLDWLDPDRKVFRHYQEDANDPQALSDNNIHVIAEDKAGNVWLGTNNGLNRLDPKTGRFHIYHHDPDKPDSLSGRMVTSLLIEGQQAWVGTWRSGLNLLDIQRGQFKHFRHNRKDPHSLSDSAVFVLHRHSNGSLWVGTWGGLDKMTDDGGFRRYHERDGLADKVINGILEDANGDLWISSNRGISRFSPDTEAFTHFDVADGLQSLEFNSRSFASGKNGEMFFGGVNGVNGFFPNQWQANPYPPEARITHLTLNREWVPISTEKQPSILGMPIGDTSSLTLQHGTAIGLQFAALHFANPSRNRYAFQLDGHDEDWIHVDSANRLAAYSYLPSGNYQFRLKAANKDGLWGKEVTPLHIRVLPPWWRTSTALLIYGLILLGLAWLAQAFYAARLRKEREMAKHLDQLVALRTEELATSNQALNQSQKELEDKAQLLRDQDALKTRFFTNISHELRTPLTLLMGSVEDMHKGRMGDMTESIQETLGIMENQSQSLLGLINQLLDLSRLEADALPLRLRRFDLVSTMKNWIESFRPMAERKQVDLRLQTIQEQVDIEADPHQLERVVTNLVSNALKYAPREGSVTLELVSENEAALIRVTDNGPGIPKDQLPYVFDRFYQADDPIGQQSTGSGIGLALSRELVLKHGGTIKVSSREGEGCCFDVNLPLRQPEGVATIIETGAAPAALPAISTVSMTPNSTALETPTFHEDTEEEDARPLVLVVEDHRELRTWLASHLRAHYRVREVSDGGAGLKAAFQLIPDLIVSDVMMPGLDGMELCRVLKRDERTCHIPVLLLTARTSMDNKLKGFDAGADDYVTKPFSATELAARIHSFIQNRKILRNIWQGDTLFEDHEEIASADAVFLKKALGVMETNLANSSFGVYELAEEMGFGRRQLHRKITALTGEGPAQFIRHYRLQKAARMLTAQSGSVSEIAYAVGFKDARHFSQLFRKEFGKAPSRYAS